jgi:acyl-CoA synthetase (AMP-forming)/AMP-acid ligase II
MGMIDGLGLRRGDRALFYTSHELESLVLQYAANLAGATIVSVDTRSVAPAELPRIAGETEARVIFVSPRFGSEGRVEALQAAFATELEPFARGSAVGYEAFASKRLRSLRHIVSTGTEAVDGFIRMMDVPVWGEGASLSFC